MIKITPQHYKPAYEFGRLVLKCKLRPTDAQAELVPFRLNSSGDPDFVDALHFKEIFSIAQRYHVDPVQDFRPVCPNCHAMLHRRVPAYTIDEPKKLVLKHG